MKRWASVLPLAAAAAAWGHEGHGLPGTGHWHPTDAFGLAALAVALAALALWWGARK